jgi:hypothetical protein
MGGRPFLLAWPSVKERIGIGLVLSELLADRNRRGSYAESVPISHLYSQPWNLSSHSMGRLGEWFDFREWNELTFPSDSTLWILRYFTLLRHRRNNQPLPLCLYEQDGEAKAGSTQTE